MSAPATPPAEQYDAIILGAGVTGLTLAWELARRRFSVLVVEAADRVGGVVQSVRRGGYLLERGPNSFSSSPPEMLRLVESIGLRSRALVRPMMEHDRYVWKAGRLRKVPTGPGALLTTNVLTAGEKLRLLAGIVGRYEPPTDDPTLGAFFRARLGDGPVETLLKPFTAGIYAADADRISFAATFPKLYDAVARSTSMLGAIRSMRRSAPKKVPRAPRALVSFPDGLEELPRRLTEELVRMGAKVRLGVKATLHDRPGGGGFAVKVPWAAEPIAGGRVILALPAHEAAALIEPVAPDVARELQSLEYARLNVIHAGAAASRFREPRDGFGFLTVANQGVDILGSIWSSSIFPGRAPEGHRLLTCFYGGEKHREANDWDDATLKATLVQDLAKTMGFDGGEPDLFEVTRWQGALPIFRPGHRQRMAALVAKMPEGLELAGSFLGGVSMPDRAIAAGRMVDPPK